MRFALIATTAAAVASVPLAAHVASPSMSSDQFLAAVRCPAYEDVTRPSADLGEIKMQLNAEARRQPSEIARTADAEVGAIAHLAALTNTPDQAEALHSARAQACATALVAAGLPTGGAG